jgi:hypothetical protein
MTASPALAVIKREFLTGLRSPKPFLFLAVLLLIMILGLVFILGIVVQDMVRYGGSISTREVRTLFMVFSFGLYFSAMLLVPPMAAVSICVEKQQDSYDLLRMTYISPFALALAKLFNVLGIYTLVAIATLPVVGVFFFLVGIDWPQFVQSALIIAFSALSSAIIGLACSAKFYRTLPAIMTTYAIGFLLQGGLLLLFALVTEVLWPYTWISSLFNRFGVEFAAALCPMFALVVLAEGRLSVVILGANIFYQLAIIVVGLRIALSILRRPAEPMKVDQEKPIDDQTVLQARRKSFPYYLIDPRRRRAMIPDGSNPLYHKELQTGLLGKGTFSVRIFYGFTIFCLVVSIFAVVGGNFGIRDVAAFVGWPILIDTIVILILTPSLVAMGMSKEHEWGNLDMLRMTLLEPKQIINGKFRTGLYTALIPVSGAVLGSIPLGIFGWHSGDAWAAAFTGFGTMVVCVLYVLALTLMATATCKRGVSALLLGYGTSIGALVLFPLALFVMFQAARTYSRNFNVVGEFEERLIAFTSPLAAQLTNLESPGYYNDTSMFNFYWIANALFFGLVTLALFRLAGRRLARHLQRGVG